MVKIAFVLIYLILAVAGRLTNSAHLRTQENDGSMSLANTLDKASTPLIQPNERVLMRRDSESGALSYGAETPTCYSGYWGEGVCVPCPIGTYSESGINVCVPCEPGYYNDQEGQYQCTRCAQDEIAPSPGSTVCTWCSMLTYTIDNINCITKPTSLPTQLTPTENCNCESGYYCNDIRCVPCSRGSYWKPFHSGYPYGFCDSCPPGTFSDEESSTQCKSCPPGTVAPGSYSTYCSSCPAPSYTVDGITCVDPIVPIIPPPVPPIFIPPVPPSISCRDGTNEVAGVCVPCEPGTYSTWGLKCYPCPPGHIAPDYGATICWRCVGNTISIKGIYCI